MLDAAGCDVILVETVGVGQSEVEIAAMADTTLVLLAPGMGDAIQAAKAGILEIGDLYVINKADRDGADQVRRELRSMLGAGRARRGRVEARDHQDRRQQGRGHRRGGGRDREAPRAPRPPAASSSKRRLQRARDEIEAIAVTALREQWRGVHENAALDELAAEVVAGDSDPYAAADLLLENLEKPDQT